MKVVFTLADEQGQLSYYMMPHSLTLAISLI